MEIESLEDISLFQPVTQIQANSLSQHQVLIQSPCSLTPGSSYSHSLKLVANTLILIEQSQFPQFLQLKFEVKFQILYEEQKNINSTKIGISIFNQQNKSLSIYFQSDNAERWTMILTKLLNQRGFHQMFKPIKKLGKGNFASVYETQRLTDNKRFAVKAFCKKNSYSAQNGKESLINQLKILRQLNIQPHKNVLKMESVYESQNSIYVVFELLTGKTLYQTVVDRKGIFNQEQINVIMLGLIQGLHHIHSYRIMHRDLKPQNIMIRGDSLEPVIVDFGLSSHSDIDKYLFYRCGTPGYVAPQIIKLKESQKIDVVCDMFSLGCIYHSLLIRRPVFEGTKYDQVYRNNKQCKINFQSNSYKFISFNALDLLIKMLKKDPLQRITSRQALQHPEMKGNVYETTNDALKSPALTAISETNESKKKKKLFIFF